MLLFQNYKNKIIFRFLQSHIIFWMLDLGGRAVLTFQYITASKKKKMQVQILIETLFSICLLRDILIFLWTVNFSPFVDSFFMHHIENCTTSSQLLFLHPFPPCAMHTLISTNKCWVSKRNQAWGVKIHLLVPSFLYVLDSVVNV